MTREEAARIARAIEGARVVDAKISAGVLVLELFHRGTDDDAYRIAFDLQHAVADAWPWPQGDAA